MQSTTQKAWIPISGTLTHRESYGWIRWTALSILFAGFTGLFAQLRLYLPFTPVPVTGQVFAVLLSGLLLGKKYGPLSQVFYLTLGMAGIPWFVIGPIGPTGGYIVGFIVAPFIIGELMEREHVRSTGSTKVDAASFTKVFSIALAGVAAIYVLGLIQFTIYTQTGLIRSIRYAVLPFIPFDILKAALAAATVRTLMR